MNSCILMVEVIQEPQIRYTQDNQTPVAEMMVQFPSLRAEEPPAKIKAVGWGNLASELHERYHPQDRLVIEGRLRMSTIDRPEGFREKQAELIAQRIYPVTLGEPLVGTPATSQIAPPPKPEVSPTPPQSTSEPPSYDQIPF